MDWIRWARDLLEAVQAIVEWLEKIWDKLP